MATNGDPLLAVHQPVLPAAVLQFLAPQPGQTIVDCTVGGGGHAALIAERLGPAGRLIGLDQDPAMLAKAKARLSGSLPSGGIGLERGAEPPTVKNEERRIENGQPRTDLVQANFRELPSVLARLGIDRVDGVLADLGFASDQMADANRGLSFQREGPLDMRLDPNCSPSAAEILADFSEEDLANLFYELGEERFSRRIARRIVAIRGETPLTTTTQLAELVRRCVPRGPGQKIDPATRVFQALRIAVNRELSALDDLLTALPRVLKPGGRAVLISFHSLEDRRVKTAFRDRATWEVLTKKPVEVGNEEQDKNPRARSAKLRAAVIRSAATSAG